MIPIAFSEKPTPGLDALPEGVALHALLCVDAAVSIVDVRAHDQPLVFVNDAFCRLTGYSRSEVLGRNCRMLQPPDRDRSTTALVREAIQLGQGVSTVIRNQRRDGSTFWNALQLVPLVGEEERVTHYVGYQRDLTARGLLISDEVQQP